MDLETDTGNLLHRLAFSLDRASNQLLENQLGIGLAQFKILLALKWRAGIQQKQIANYLTQTEASISRQIKLMHRRGLIKTQPSPRSRRDHLTTLTSKGDRVAQKAIDLLNDYYQPMFARLSPKQQQNLREALIIMNDYASSLKSRDGQ